MLKEFTLPPAKPMHTSIHGVEISMAPFGNEWEIAYRNPYSAEWDCVTRVRPLVVERPTWAWSAMREFVSPAEDADQLIDLLDSIRTIHWNGTKGVVSTL